MTKKKVVNIESRTMSQSDNCEKPVQSSSTSYLQAKDRSHVFDSPIITVLVGDSLEPFQVHRDVLQQVEELAEEIMYIDPEPKLPRVDPSTFKMALYYMYGGCHSLCTSNGTSIFTKEEEISRNFRLACGLYAFAEECHVTELLVQTKRDITAFDSINYQTVVEAAKVVYKNCTSVGKWFRDFLVEHTQRALSSDAQVADQSWFVDIFQGQYGNMGSEIFKVFRDVTTESHNLLTPSTTNSTSVSLEPSAAYTKEEKQKPASGLPGKTRPASSELLKTEAAPTEHESRPVSPDPWAFWSVKPGIKMSKKRNCENLEDYTSRLKFGDVRTYTGEDDTNQSTESTAEPGSEVREPKMALKDDSKAQEQESQIVASDSVDRSHNANTQLTEPGPELKPEREATMISVKQWDFGLGPKGKKRKMRRMMAKGVVFDDLKNPIYSESTCVSGVWSWDFGLTPKGKRSKRKKMMAVGVEFNVFDQPIYAETVVTSAFPEETIAKATVSEQLTSGEIDQEEPAEVGSGTLPMDHIETANMVEEKKKTANKISPEVDDNGNPNTESTEDRDVSALKEEEPEPDSVPEQIETVSATCEDFVKAPFDITMVFAITYRGMQYNVIRREKIAGWVSVCNAIIQAIAAHLLEKDQSRRLWIDNVQVLCEQSWFDISGDIPTTLLALQREWDTAGRSMHLRMDLLAGKNKPGTLILDTTAL